MINVGKSKSEGAYFIAVLMEKYPTSITGPAQPCHP